MKIYISFAKNMVYNSIYKINILGELMKNSKKLALSLAISFALLGANPVFAATRLDLGVNTGNVSFSEGTFNLNQDENLKNQVLAEARAIRSRLWDENILYTLDENSNSKSERLQDVVKANGYANKEAYVNGLTWSNDLEKIAIQRAYEQTLTGLSHQRPDGSSMSTAATINGIHPGAEILASSTDSQNPKRSFGQWSFEPSKRKNNKSEYQLLKEAKGVSNADNGHLHIILDPELKHIGFAALNTNAKWNYGVGIFDFAISGNNQASANLVGSFNIYAGDIKRAPKIENKTVAPAKTTELSAASVEKLRTSVSNAKRTIAGAELLMKTMPKFAKENGAKINELIANSQKIIDQAEKILAKY